MTEDFKEKILKYLVGKYEVDEEGRNIPYFSELTSETTELITQLDEQFPYGYTQKGYVLAKDNNGNNNGFVIVYGKYYTDSTKANTKSYILLLDNKLNLLQVLTQYTSNVDFENIQLMNVDNEGYVYLIEERSVGKRLVLLNNISVKKKNDTNYYAQIRKAYSLQSNISNATTVEKMTKSGGSGRYLFVGKQDNNNVPLVTEFVINVGSTNEWNDYTYTDTLNEDFIIKDLYAFWNDEDELYFTIMGVHYTIITTGTDFINADIVSFRTLQSHETPTVENEMKYNVNIESLKDYFFPNKSGILRGDIDIKHLENGIYHVVMGGSAKFADDEYIGSMCSYLWLKDFSPLIFTLMSENQGGYISRNSENCTCKVELIQANELNFCKFMFNDTAYSTTDTDYKVNIQCYTSNILNPSSVLELASTNTESLEKFNVLAIKNEYNLYAPYYIINAYDYSTQQYEYKKLATRLIYNQNNYNGYEKQFYNSMVPNSGVLYDENDIAIFARNLYNKTINNNTTTSTIEIPNTVLNDIEIAKENLIGKGNNILVESNYTISTNIYEALYFNFYNTLIIKNANNKQNEILNPIGASRLNYDISANGTEESYNNTKGTKLKINYDDNTSYIREIDTSTDVEITDNIAEIKFTIYVPLDKNITNIQIISNDEITIYQEITNLSLENGKFYQLTQMVEVI